MLTFFVKLDTVWSNSKGIRIHKSEIICGMVLYNNSCIVAQDNPNLSEEHRARQDQGNIFRTCFEQVTYNSSFKFNYVANNFIYSIVHFFLTGEHLRVDRSNDYR